jgi:hypothetical protein
VLGHRGPLLRAHPAWTAGHVLLADHTHLVSSGPAMTAHGSLDPIRKESLSWSI